jgi:hypothetical protein
MTPEAVEGTNIRTWIGLLRGVDSTGVFNLSGDYLHLAIKTSIVQWPIQQKFETVAREVSRNADKFG